MFPLNLRRNCRPERPRPVSESLYGAEVSAVSCACSFALAVYSGVFLKLRVTASADRVLFCPYRAAEICVHLRSFRKERTSPGWGCGTVSAWVYYSGFRLGTAFRWGCLKTVCRCRYPAIRAIRPSWRHALLSCRGVYGRSRTGTLPKPAADNAAVTS